jgi:hypothetical protein
MRQLLALALRVGLWAMVSMALLLGGLVCLIWFSGGMATQAARLNRPVAEVLIGYSEQLVGMSLAAFLLGLIFAGIAYGLTRTLGKRIYDAQRYVLYGTLFGGLIGFLVVVFIHVQAAFFRAEDLPYTAILALWFAFIGNRFAALDLSARRKTKG